MQHIPEHSLANITPELFVNILLNLSDKDLDNAFRTDTRAAEVCADDSFWNNRIKHVFSYKLGKYKEDDVSYRTMYEFFVEHKNSEISQTVSDAIEAEYLSILRYIIGEIQPEYDINRVLETAAINGCLNIIIYLIEEAGATDLDNALVNAAGFGNLANVKYLVEKGAGGLNIALMEASFRKHHEMANYLHDEVLKADETRNQGNLMLKYLEPFQR